MTEWDTYQNSGELRDSAGAIQIFWWVSTVLGEAITKSAATPLHVEVEIRVRRKENDE